MTIGSPILAIRRAPADHDTQACCLGPTLSYIQIWNFYHEWNIVAIPDPGLFIISASDTDATENCHSGSSWTAGHKNKKKKQVLI